MEAYAVDRKIGHKAGVRGKNEEMRNAIQFLASEEPNQAKNDDHERLKHSQHAEAGLREENDAARPHGHE